METDEKFEMHFRDWAKLPDEYISANCDCCGKEKWVHKLLSVHRIPGIYYVCNECSDHVGKVAGTNYYGTKPEWRLVLMSAEFLKRKSEFLKLKDKKPTWFERLISKIKKRSY